MYINVYDIICFVFYSLVCLIIHLIIKLFFFFFFLQFLGK